MAYLNKATLIGNIGKDAEVRMTQNGRKCVTIALATSRKYKNSQGELMEDTQWHNVVCWNKVADAMERMHLAKGTALYVEGTITYRKYDKDGSVRYITEIVADNIQVLTPRNNSQQAPQQSYSATPQQQSYEQFDDGEDFPF